MSAELVMSVIIDAASSVLCVPAGSDPRAYASTCSRSGTRVGTVFEGSVWDLLRIPSEPEGGNPGIYVRVCVTLLCVSLSLFVPFKNCFRLE